MQGREVTSFRGFLQWMERCAPGTVRAIEDPEEPPGRKNNGGANGAFLDVEAGTFIAVGKA